MQTVMILLLVTGILLASSRAMAAQTKAPIRAELNGLTLAFDPDSGGLIEMSYDGAKLLESPSENAALLDAACPGQGFDPLRLGARYSSGARVDVSAEGIVISWKTLGTSRPVGIGGPVSAEVRIRPAADGRSLVLTAVIDNHSKAPIPQVLFPDFAGLRPFAGKENTELRTCGFVKKPFLEMELAEDDGWWYAAQRNWADLHSGAYDKSMAARWMDFGNRQSGFSLFPKQWGGWELTKAGDPTTEHVLLHLSQIDGTLRLMCEHRVDIAPGERWSSPEYVLTPRRHGWAKGIEPFRVWLRENRQRPYPMPRRLRETLGYRSVWMAQQYANTDPGAPTVVWRFCDLPGLADECIEHGLNEMVLWLWQPWEIPDQPSPELGSVEEMQQAIAACRDKGVNVSLFVSVMTLIDPQPAKYGWNNGEEYWAYHTDFIPMARPYYGIASRGAFAKQEHPAWQADVTSSLLGMIARGWTSIAWDQALHAPHEPNLETIFRQVRAAAKQADPESTFAGESLNNIDLDSRWLDYTWNWALFAEDTDWRALVNAYDAPRFNVNVGNSPKVVKRLFMDHLFLNVLPSKPEGINGSAHIVDYPKLSAALKTCAKLHRQFRSFFEGGLIVGDCVLSEACPDARINAYVLPESVLVIVMNTSGTARAISFACDLAPWLDSVSGRFAVTPYNEAGQAGAARTEASAIWTETTPTLEPEELALCVVRPVPSLILRSFFWHNGIVSVMLYPKI